MLTLHYLNALFTGLFTLETFLKVHAFGPRVSLSARSRKPSSSPPTTSLHLEPRTHLSDSLHLDYILCISCMSSVHNRTWLHEYRIALDALPSHVFQITPYTLLEGTMSSNDFTSPIILIELIIIFLLYFITQYVYAPLIFICITCSVFDMTKVIFSKHHFLRSNLQSHSFDPASPSTHLYPSQAIKQNSN